MRGAGHEGSPAALGHQEAPACPGAPGAALCCPDATGDAACILAPRAWTSRQWARRRIHPPPPPVASLPPPNWSVECARASPPPRLPSSPPLSGEQPRAELAAGGSSTGLLPGVPAPRDPSSQALGAATQPSANKGGRKPRSGHTLFQLVRPGSVPRQRAGSLLRAGRTV